MITRGTTPYHTFFLPLQMDTIEELYVTYMQNGEVILDKNSTDVTIEDATETYENANVEIQEEQEINYSTKITLHLTQEDTLGFNFYPAAEKNTVVIQIRVLTTDGEAYASNPIRERIYGILKDGVIGDDSVAE